MTSGGVFLYIGSCLHNTSLGTKRLQKIKFTCGNQIKQFGSSIYMHWFMLALRLFWYTGACVEGGFGQGALSRNWSECNAACSNC